MAAQRAEGVIVGRDGVYFREERRIASLALASRLPSVAPQTPLRLAASALLEAGLPVVDDEGRVVGFVSRADMLRAALRDAGLDAWG